MSWSEIKKAVNSDLSTPLNTLINNRPKGYKLKLDSYEKVDLKNTTKTYTSTTGGIVKMQVTNDVMLSYFNDIIIDGASLKDVLGAATMGYSGFVVFKDSNYRTYEFPFGNSFQISGSTSSNYTYIAVYKNVPIT